MGCVPSPLGWNFIPLGWHIIPLGCKRAILETGGLALRNSTERNENTSWGEVEKTATGMLYLCNANLPIAPLL
jgi:hypothetical protein